MGNRYRVMGNRYKRQILPSPRRADILATKCRDIGENGKMETKEAGIIRFKM